MFNHDIYGILFVQYMQKRTTKKYINSTPTKQNRLHLKELKREAKAMNEDRGQCISPKHTRNRWNAVIGLPIFGRIVQEQFDTVSLY
jgi:hypothetical protein